MSTTDTQDRSPEELELFAKAKKAASEFQNYSADQVRKIFEAIGNAALEKAEFYAEWAVRDTGYGNFEDKAMKKKAAATTQLASFDPADFINPVVDKEKKIISFPRPAGVVVTLVPCTNPVFGLIGMVMQMVATRNVLVICPHPAAKEVCLHAIDLFHEAGVAAGAPENFIVALREISVPAVNSIMTNPDTDLITAVGGPAMVHAAYSSGNPAFGVGAGNVPSYIHKSADPVVAGQTLLISSRFDYSLPCTTESVALVDESVAGEVREAMKAVGGYFLNAEEEQKVRDFCWPEGAINPDIIGQSPEWLAEKSGITIPEGTASLVIEIESVGSHEVVSKEKMWPIVGFKVIKGGVDEAISDALTMLDVMGKGHSASIHAKDPLVIAKYAQFMPVGRMSVNANNSMVSAGWTSNLTNTVMIGTGFWGGGITAENVHPESFIQWTRVAYEADSDVDMDAVEKAVESL